MPSFADSIFLFVLALLLFGPKQLPVLARELGKWMGEFRRASNEFKMQMEDELRASEQADRQKQIAAMEAAAPIPPPLGEPAEPEHPHLRHNAPPADPTESPTLAEAASSTSVDTEDGPTLHPESADRTTASPEIAAPLVLSPLATTELPPSAGPADDTRPLPIATSGSLKMMPPATGLPTARSGRSNGNALSGLVDAIPEALGPKDSFETVPSAGKANDEVAHGD